MSYTAGESALWQALGRWSSEICRPDAELAPPKYLLDAVAGLVAERAADEIERLRAERDALRELLRRVMDCGDLQGWSALDASNLYDAIDAALAKGEGE